jgi:ribose/xylose/arabinose/galactoside ABC-type transport system permease subunit
MEKDFENGPQNIYNLYEQVSYNGFVAAGLYLLLGGFSVKFGSISARNTWCASVLVAFTLSSPLRYLKSP